MLREYRHVCAFFNTPDDAAAATASLS